MVQTLPLTCDLMLTILRIQARDVLDQYRVTLHAKSGHNLHLPRPQRIGSRGTDWVAVDAGEFNIDI